MYLGQGWEVISDQEDGFLVEKFVEYIQARIRISAQVVFRVLRQPEVL